MARGTSRGVYTPDFYDTIAAGCRESAAVVIPLVLKHLGLEAVSLDVLDVGCGQGWWGKELQDRGATVLGLDGEYVPDCQLDNFLAHDLTTPLPDFLPQVDLVICLEVAEHLPPDRAESFVADLLRLGRNVVFSAAIPHQTGAGHINLRWSSYWAGLFAAAGHEVDAGLRSEIWDDDLVEVWYRNNLLTSRRGSLPEWPVDAVHPILHEWGRTA